MAQRGYGVLQAGVFVGLILLADASIAAHGQGNGSAIAGPVPSVEAATPACASVHPGTAILDSMGIYAGAPGPVTAAGDKTCEVHPLRQDGG